MLGDVGKCCSLAPVFELPGEGAEGVEPPPTVFSTPITDCQIMYWWVTYMLYT